MKFDNNKSPIYDLIKKYEEAFTILSIARLYGDLKYGIASSWRTVNDDKIGYANRTKNSIARHLAGGLLNDEESGLPHPVHAIFQLLILSELQFPQTENPFIKFGIPVEKQAKTSSVEIDELRANWEELKEQVFQGNRAKALGELLIDFPQTLFNIALLEKRIYEYNLESNDIIEEFNKSAELILLSGNADSVDKNSNIIASILMLIRLLQKNFTSSDIFFNGRKHI